MYKIVDVKSGAQIGVTEKPNFIKKSSAGCFVKATEKKAQGVAYQSTAYNLQGRAGIGVSDTVALIEFDAGSTVAENSAAIDNLIVAMLEG